MDNGDISFMNVLSEHVNAGQYNNENVNIDLFVFLDMESCSSVVFTVINN